MPDPLCVDVERAAEMLGMSATCVRSYIEKGLLPIIKFPSATRHDEKSRRVLIAVTDLAKFVEAHRVTEK